IFVTDRNGVRRIAPSGLVTTIAAGFNAPAGIVVDATDRILVADSGNHSILAIEPPSAPPPARRRAARRAGILPAGLGRPARALSPHSRRASRPLSSSPPSRRREQPARPPPLPCQHSHSVL